MAPTSINPDSRGQDQSARIAHAVKLGFEAVDELRHIPGTDIISAHRRLRAGIEDGLRV